MTETPACPTCGIPVPAGSPGGACPRCLLAAGLESGSAADRADPLPPDEMARHFPQMEVLEVLGQGGMGVVYKARHRNLDRLVALKVLPPEAAREPGFPERFTREARTLARLQHPHIVGVHDFGETGGLYYLVMEFVDGPNLRQVLREGSLEPKQALAIVPQVCDALQYAHEQGIVHRDIKPENILLDRSGRVKIADFGLAKIVQRAPVDLTLTREGQVMGTLHYMAPEQYRAPDTVDHRADIYSLGVVFYEMLTGELPMGVFPPPSRRQGVDARLDGVVMRALEKERNDRWQHASELRTRLDTIAAGPAPAGAAAAPPPPPSPGAGTRFLPEEDPAAPLSRLAVIGGLAAPGALLAGLLVGGFLRLLGAGRHGSEAGFYTSVVLGLAGWLAALVAWRRIRHSGGSLRGRRWALAGVLVTPLLLCCPGWFLFGNVAEPDLRPAADLLTDSADPAVRAPRTWDALARKLVARDIEDLWTKQGAGLLHQTYGGGEEGRSPGNWKVFCVAVMADGVTGRVVVSDGKNTIAFPVSRDGKEWTVPEGGREARPGAPVEADRDGELFR